MSATEGRFAFLEELEAVGYIPSTSSSGAGNRVRVEMEVAGELFKQLAAYCAYSKEGQVLVKIKVADIHVQWDHRRENFCGRSDDEGACSGINLETECNSIYLCYPFASNIYGHLCMTQKLVFLVQL